MACKILALGEGARGGKRDISLALTVQRGGGGGEGILPLKRFYLHKIIKNT